MNKRVELLKVSKFEAKSICILGRQPALGLAELESRYGAERVRPMGSHALLDIEAVEIEFKKLGGVVRVARILSTLPYTDWPRLYKYLADNIPKHVQHLPTGGFTLGVSLYGLEVRLGKFKADLLSLKKLIRASGRSVRVVPNNDHELSSAQVLHNKLTHLGAWELLLIKDGQQTYLAQTLFVQDIEAYAARDQARPKRDARVGMLPPKLAQIIVNLAAGPLERKRIKETELKPRPLRVLDPFCGTGVLLQEALLMGHSVIGSDIEPRMVDYSRANIEWLIQKYPGIEGYVVIEQADATNYRWPRFSVVASEVYLGRPLAQLPPPDQLKQITSDVNTVIKKFLINLAAQLVAGQRVVLALPAWQTGRGLVHLPLIDRISSLGYNRLDLVHVKSDDLVYARPNQIVARELLILEKQ